jgi:hypothetical protein
MLDNGPANVRFGKWNLQVDPPRSSGLCFPR